MLPVQTCPIYKVYEQWQDSKDGLQRSAMAIEGPAAAQA